MRPTFRVTVLKTLAYIVNRLPDPDHILGGEERQALVAELQQLQEEESWPPAVGEAPRTGLNR